VNYKILILKISKDFIINKNIGNLVKILKGMFLFGKMIILKSS